MSKRSALPRPSSSRSRASSRASASRIPEDEPAPAPTPRAPPAEQTFDTSTLPPSLLRLHQKQQEYASLQALQEASSVLVAKVEGIAEMGNVMADGGEAIGQVFQNWKYVFAILSQLDQVVPKPTGDEDDVEPVPTMVRMKYGGEEE